MKVLPILVTRLLSQLIIGIYLLCSIQACEARLMVMRK